MFCLDSKKILSLFLITGDEKIEAAQTQKKQLIFQIYIAIKKYGILVKKNNQYHDFIKKQKNMGDDHQSYIKFISLSKSEN